MYLEVVACIASGPAALADVVWFADARLTYQAHHSTASAVVLVTPAAARIKGKVLAFPISPVHNVHMGHQVIEFPFAPLLVCLGAVHVRHPVEQAVVTRSRLNPSEFDGPNWVLVVLEEGVGREVCRRVVERLGSAADGCHSAQKKLALACVL